MTARGEDAMTLGVLSIGALSAATGIPIETIRTWERRYGFPEADRKPSGHRIYPVSTVSRLRLIGTALSQGHRAAEVVGLAEPALEALLASIPAPDRPPRSRLTALSDILVPADPAELFDAVKAFDSERLRASFRAEWARRGPLDFLEQSAAPFLIAIGAAWAAGELAVRHEHFASACLGDFLRTVRAPMDERARGPIAALTTLPGEYHGVGLQMAAVVFAIHGWRALMLGVDTPIEQIVALTRETPIGAVGVSCVRAPTPQGAAQLHDLRRRLPSGIPLLVGGTMGSQHVTENGIEVMESLASLDAWLLERSRV